MNGVGWLLCVQIGLEMRRLLRPNVAWFGERLSPHTLESAQAANDACDRFSSIGTSTAVKPAAGLPFRAVRAGVRVVEVNPVGTPLTSRATWVLRGSSRELLSKLLFTTWPRTRSLPTAGREHDRAIGATWTEPLSGFHRPEYRHRVDVERGDIGKYS